VTGDWLAPHSYGPTQSGHFNAKPFGTNRRQLRAVDAEWVSAPMPTFHELRKVMGIYASVAAFQFEIRGLKLAAGGSRTSNWRLGRHREDRRNEVDPAPGSTIE
jgi:hypothetical protein